MRQCYAFEFETPKGYTMRALWFGPRNAKQVIVFIHGLGGSAFSMAGVLDTLVDKQTAVLAFNNRGFETISTLRKKDSEQAKGGAAHEKFTDCVDDIDGAIRAAKTMGGKVIYLAGHSTGCQKAVYWAYKKGKGVKGLILLGPISDYEAELHRKGRRTLEKAVAYARKLIANGKPHELLPGKFWHETLDAQRFVSLYTPDTAENIFPYGRPQQRATALRSITLPVLVFWAEHDEFGDRPANEIAAWFDATIRSPHRVVVVPKVGHGFKGGERTVAREVKRFIAQK